MSLRPALESFWQTRSKRERLALAAGSALVVLAACYAALWQPMSRDNARMDEQLPRLRAQVAQIARSGDEIERLRAKAPVGSTQPAEAASAAQRAAATFGLQGKIAATDQAGARIHASFERVTMNAWIGWIDELHRNHRLVLVKAKLSSADAPGWLRAEAELAPAAELK
jgi:type II secretory pathway component PulM